MGVKIKNGGELPYAEEFCDAGSEEIVKNHSGLYEVRKSFLKLFLDFKTSIGYFDSNVGFVLKQKGNGYGYENRNLRRRSSVFGI